MDRAIRLAEKAIGRTSPNPLVGAVLVRSGRITSEGHHRRAGDPHAEVVAIKAAGSRAHGATLYVNLEPCGHLEKRTPPCVKPIIESGIRRVVVAMRDPNPKVAGRGIALLRRAGIRVTEGILKDRAKRLNEVYSKYITTRKPFVILKSAVTLDGKIAVARGSASRITGEEARREAHRLRDRTDAVMVGIETVLVDDPRLTTRLPGGRGRDSIRVILDSTLRVPLKSRVLTESSEAETWIVTTRRAHPDRIRAVEHTGAKVIIAKDREGRIDLLELMTRLGEMGVTNVLIEGGGRINASALAAGIVDKVVWFIAPFLAGGRDSVGVLGDDEDRSGRSSFYPVLLREVTVRPLGRDIMLEGYP